MKYSRREMGLLLPALAATATASAQAPQVFPAAPRTRSAKPATNSTIEVEIKEVPAERGGWEWAIEPKDAAANEARFREHEAEFRKKWEERNPKKPPSDHHFPIVFKQGETLAFTCADGLAFGIGAKKNPDVDEFPGAPDNPFGWPGLQIGTEGSSVSAVVITIANGPGPKEQAFYKFHGWVRLADGTYKQVDPDGYCGS